MAGRFKETKKVGQQSGGPQRGRPSNLVATTAGPSASSYEARKREEQRQLEAEQDEELDVAFGFARETTHTRTAYLYNMRQSSIKVLDGRSADSTKEESCLDLYFVEEDGSTFKASHLFQPYFLLHVNGNSTVFGEVEQYLLGEYDDQIVKIEHYAREDLELPNHLAGLERVYMKLYFKNVDDQVLVRNRLSRLVEKNREAHKQKQATGMDDDMASSGRQVALESEGAAAAGGMRGGRAGTQKKRDQCMSAVIDMREYDVTYVTRVAIDSDIRCGCWYDVTPEHGRHHSTLLRRADKKDAAPLKKMAFDIETTKPPLKFPNAASDNVMMISYMLEGAGYLIVNRAIVSEDIADFEYTPKPEYEGLFTVFNEPDEKATLERWLQHIEQEKPLLYVTYNGDFFDWPFLAKRCEVHNIDMRKRIGVWEQSGEYMGRFSLHLDAFCWVKRDSYLPQGSQGLKAVTKNKLKYEPVELDPESMLPYARDRPQDLAAYSVSDAVATYYLYTTYVHMFVFSLSSIIPLPVSDVLRKGSGTLCEALLMVEAFNKRIVCPNKERSEPLSFHKGHLLESETYIGGHVEALESGVFRSNLPTKFKLVPRRLDELMANLDRTLEFAIVVEGKLSMEDVEPESLAQVKAAIEAKLRHLREHPNIEVNPRIYHLDVGAMYPNIILTNRLQPMAIVDEAVCAACDFNRPGAKCQKWMRWSWRGRYYPATNAEVQTIMAQLKEESFKQDADSMALRKPVASFEELPRELQAKRIIARVKKYSSTVYKGHVREDVEERLACICQRENPFYVDTVRNFRDRRYVYKALGKDAQKKYRDAKNELDKVKASDEVLLYESLQLAHKCILNSFYGYVMRRGARWHSIEMAGVVTQTGANIIKDARILVEEIGRPLELDTDGIWCMLPSTFPESFQLKLKPGKTTAEGKPLTALEISYPCSMLNIGVHDNYTNDRYQTRQPDGTYAISKECGIFFEVDGPYGAMILPASKDEGKGIKKRYAVFSEKGALKELKGFEIKRRGELKLIKVFQEEVFAKFLDGKTLVECYDSVGSTANHWLDVCENGGEDLEDEDVFDLISENKNMVEALSEYGDRKSTSISTAKRLGEFLGDEMIKDKGLNCRFIITKKPLGAPTSERAVPVAIFSAEPAIMKSYLRKWLKDPGLSDFDVKKLIDWDYYIGRLKSAIQKIITIPAAFQKVPNPVPRVEHPDWLRKKIKERDDTHKQTSISSFFVNTRPGADMEDIASSQKGAGDMFTNPLKQRLVRVKRFAASNVEQAKGLGIVEEEFKEQAAAAASAEVPQLSASKRSKHRVSDQAGSSAPGTGLLPAEGEDADASSDSSGSPGSRKRRDRIVLDSADEGQADSDDEAPVVPLMDGLDLEDERATSLVDKALDLAVLSPSQLSPSKARRPPRDPAAAAGSRAMGSLGARFDASAAASSDDATMAPVEAEPSETEDFAGWVRYHSAKWAKLRAARKADRAVETRLQTGARGAADQSLKLGRDGLTGFLRKTALAVRASYWQIVQLVEDETSPGLFRVWVLLDSGALRQMRVRVPRVIYVNSQRELPDSGKKVQRTLPRSRPCLHLYELSMDESEWRASEKEFTAQLSSRVEIEGVYETQLPLLFKFIMEVGCVCKLDNKTAKEVQPEYNLPDLQYKTTAECAYLSNPTQPLRRLFLYHSHAGDGRGVFGLFDETKGEVQLISVNPFRGELEKPKTKEMLRSCVDAAREVTLGVPAQEDGSEHAPRVGAGVSDVLTPSPHATFRSHQVKDLDAGFALVNNLLRSYKDETSAATVVLSQVGGLSVSSLYAHLPILRSEFPVVQLPAHLADNTYPALNWYSASVKKMIERYVAHPQWWHEQLHFCRYAHVPIGNIESDYPAFIADLFYARALKHSGHLLWLSNGPRPDLGGFEEEPNYFSDEHVNPEWSHEGVYRKVCMEIDIGQLAVNAVVQQSLIEEIEGSAGGVAVASAAAASAAPAELGQLALRSLQESSGACRDAFRVLKNCVSNWLSDTLHNQNEDADMLLRHFYRWLSSSSSKLYDGALHRFTHQLMKKILQQLLAKFRKLGSTIVFANQSKLILSTNKSSIPHALAYTKFILDSVQKNALFQMLTLEPARLWECLAFMDAANYGGILADGQDDEEDGAGDGAGSSDGKLTVTLSSGRTVRVAVHSHWNLADYLPRETQDAFVVSVAKFLVHPYKVRLEQLESHAALLAQRRAEQADFSASQHLATLGQTAEQEDAAVVAEVADYIKGEFSRELFEHVARIKAQLRGNERAGSSDAAIQFPVLAGSYLPLHNPALEFVKSVCKVLSLDMSLSTPTRVLRESLLKLVGVKSFSPEATFVPPCLTFVLPDVICSYCNQCRDLDLCRDPELTFHHWRCPVCAQPYDLGVVEWMLVEYVQRRAVAYQVQDLQCATCGKVKQSNMQRFCPCSGHFVNTVSPQQFDAQMRVFANIAVYHGFEWLKETITFVREREPEIREFDRVSEGGQDAAAALEHTSGAGRSAEASIEIE